MEITPVQERFILHWGEMGSTWGVNRTVAQIHALLYLSNHPLNAEEIMDALGIARSNVSTSLRELMGWGIIKRVHVLDDKRDHFEALLDVWELFRRVLNERKRREVDPALSLLQACIDQAGDEPETRNRLKNLQDFFQTTSGWYEEVNRWPTPIIKKLLAMADTVRRQLG